MNPIKIFLYILLCPMVFMSCNSQKTAVKINSVSDEVRIANDSLEYEIIIIEPGFESWLVSQPKQDFYNQSTLELKNKSFVKEYNYRVANPNRYSKNLYPQRIEYDFNIDYGKEVNYLLYQYFIYFQNKYNQHFLRSRN